MSANYNPTGEQKLVQSTPDNSNLPLTRTNFCFPSGHFLYNFTLDQG